MRDDNVETDTPVTATPQQSTSELPSVDRIRTLGIMSTIIFSQRSNTYDPGSGATKFARDASVGLANDLLERIERKQRETL